MASTEAAFEPVQPLIATTPWIDLVGPAEGPNVDALVDDVVEVDQPEQSVQAARPESLVRRAARRTGELAMYPVYATMSIAVIGHTAAEDSIGMNTYSHLLHGASVISMQSMEAGGEVLAGMGVVGFGVSMLANQIPFLSKKVEGLQDAPKNKALRIGKAALDGVKKPLEWAGQGIEKAAHAVNRKGNHPIAEQTLQETADVVGMGTPLATVVAKNRAGKKVGILGVARRELLFLAAYPPTYALGFLGVHGAYDVLDGMEHVAADLPVPDAGSSAQEALVHEITDIDKAVHVGFDTFGLLLDPTHLPGQIVYGVGAAAMTFFSLRSYHRDLKERKQAKVADSAESEIQQDVSDDSTVDIALPAQPAV